MIIDGVRSFPKHEGDVLGDKDTNSWSRLGLIFGGIEIGVHGLVMSGI